MLCKKQEGLREGKCEFPANNMAVLDKIGPQHGQ